MPVAKSYAISRGIVEEPTAMHAAAGHLTRICWTHHGQPHECTGTGCWWIRLNRYGTHCLHVDADILAGTTVEIHWE